MLKFLKSIHYRGQFQETEFFLNRLNACNLKNMCPNYYTKIRTINEVNSDCYGVVVIVKI